MIHSTLQKIKQSAESKAAACKTAKEQSKALLRSRNLADDAEQTTLLASYWSVFIPASGPPYLDRTVILIVFRKILKLHKAQLLFILLLMGVNNLRLGASGVQASVMERSGEEVWNAVASIARCWPSFVFRRAGEEKMTITNDEDE